jgi:uncharacterized protein (UPF0305 family)
MIIAGESYAYKEAEYRVVMKCELKLPDGQWVPGVVYARKNTNKFYCRSEDDFLSKFQREVHFD